MIAHKGHLIILKDTLQSEKYMKAVILVYERNMVFKRRLYIFKN